MKAFPAQFSAVQIRPPLAMPRLAHASPKLQGPALPKLYPGADSTSPREMTELPAR